MYIERNVNVEMKRVLDSKISAGFFDGRAVFLFGHSYATEEMADYLLEHSVSIKAIFDNNKSKQGLKYRNIPIAKPALIKNYEGYKSVVLITSRFYSEMYAQLRSFGYEGEIIQVVEYDSFSKIPFSEETLKDIRKQYPSQHLIICPYNALGDVYWAMAFLPPYCEKHGIVDYAVVVIENACCDVAGMFEENVISISKDKMNELVQAIVITQEKNCIIAHHDLPNIDNIIKYLDKHFISFIDYYRCVVYGLGKETLPVEPVKFKKYDNKDNIPKGKAVILSPYAKSVVKIPGNFWEEKAAEISGQGYSVYTNVTGDEKPVSGTVPLTVPITQLKAAAEYAGTFIGIRNGLCDILNTADCRKIVVFPDCFYSTTSHKVEDFFALPGWEKIVV